MSDTTEPGTARLPALANAELPEDLRSILARWPYRLHRTLAHAPESLKAFMPWGEHILRNNSIPPRAREIVILRVAWNARAAYEWGLHAWVARQVGMTDAEIAAIPGDATTGPWSTAEAALICAVDELMERHRITDATWGALAAHFAPKQLVDLILLVGNFTMIAWVLNGLEIPPEPGVDPLPDHPAGGESAWT
ncbi:MAG: carboxymuconolactone decarboxylase family protein [Thermaurantiacus sp.]